MTRWTRLSGSDGDDESGAAPFALELADPSADMFASNGRSLRDAGFRLTSTECARASGASGE